jgi:predicted DNA-binding transcriptional regulator YafY
MLQKSASVRYIIINRCLTSKTQKHWAIKELIDKVEEQDIRVNERTIRYDIEAMRTDDRLGYRAPIEYCRRNKGYYYTDPNYSIENINLTEEQWKSFDTVMNFLHEHKDLKVMQDFHNAIDKLSGVMSMYRNPSAASYVEFEKAPYYKGLELRDGLLDAIRNKQVVAVKYTTFGRSYPIKHIVHPYLLKEYKNRWYLIGLMESKMKPITLALDRVDAFSKMDAPYLKNVYFDQQEYFKHFIGVTFTTGDVEEIVLQATPFLANYLKTRHIHSSQEIIKEDKNGIDIRLKVIPNPELIAEILSHGKELKILSPASLKEKIKESLTEALTQYP